jgi:hypothetical protein
VVGTSKLTSREADFQCRAAAARQQGDPDMQQMAEEEWPPPADIAQIDEAPAADADSQT